MRFRRVVNLCSLLMIVAVLGACESGGGAEADDKLRGASAGADVKKRDSAKAGVNEPALPDKGGRFRPSLMRLVEEEPNIETLTEVDACAGCHAEVVTQWRDSVHAFASLNNPLYRMSLDAFVEASGEEKARFCNGCHEPSILFDTGLEDRFGAHQERAQLGVTCATCHGVTEARTDGNASISIATSEIFIPDPKKPEEVARHRKRVTTSKVSEEALCVSCHRGFLDEQTGHDVHILGIDEFAPWRRSPWAGNQVTRLPQEFEAQTCVDCHMPESDAGVSSHRFAGGHSTLAKMIGSEDQLEAVRDMLEQAATLDIAAVGTGSEARPSTPGTFHIDGGERVWTDVVVRNTGVGHRLPGGVPDLKDTWLEVVVEDAGGEPVAQAGVDHAETGEDPTAHRLRVLLLHDDGANEVMHTVAHFRTAGFDHTIAARGAATVRFGWQLPEDLGDIDFPVKVRARLRHRRLNTSFQQAACEHSKTERGRAFAEAGEKFLGRVADPCVEQPIIDMASAEASISTDGFELADKSEWLRWYERGLGLQAHLSERLGETHDSFERALAALADEGEDRDADRAKVLVARAQVFARQGSQHAAIDYFDRAEDLVGPHPAIFFGRGRAYARVWDFGPAIEEFQKAAEMADDDRIWRRLAQGLGSLSRPEGSIEAAQRGLIHEPRDASLLRSQWRALRDLDASAEHIAGAAAAYDEFKKDEDAHLIEAMCGERSELCQLERLPVHSHELQTVE